MQPLPKAPASSFASAALLVAMVLGACSGNLVSPAAEEAGVRGVARDAGLEADGAVGPSGSASWLRDLPAVDVECGDDDSTRLYEQRIEPLFSDDRPSSCNECHLSGLDLQVFMRDTPCETMACMVSLGLVDEENPDESKVLDWIARADPESPLITEAVIEEEYLGFREWIHYSASCDECDGVTCPGTGDGGKGFCVTELEPMLGYDPNEADPGGCSDAALLEVFRATMYASRGRCSPCHYTDHDFEEYQAPQWLDVEGDCESASRNTYWNVLDRGYVDVEEPTQSLLLLKPLSEDIGGIEHGGHDKFWSVTEDQGYLNFRYFIERYADCR